jgi:hypothetical protein
MGYSAEGTKPSTECVTQHTFHNQFQSTGERNRVQTQIILLHRRRTYLTL